MEKAHKVARAKHAQQSRAREARQAETTAAAAAHEETLRATTASEAALAEEPHERLAARVEAGSEAKMQELASAHGDALVEHERVVSEMKEAHQAARAKPKQSRARKARQAEMTAAMRAEWEAQHAKSEASEEMPEEGVGAPAASPRPSVLDVLLAETPPRPSGRFPRRPLPTSAVAGSARAAGDRSMAPPLRLAVAGGLVAALPQSAKGGELAAQTPQIAAAGGALEARGLAAPLPHPAADGGGLAAQPPQLTAAGGALEACGLAAPQPQPAADGVRVAGGLAATPSQPMGGAPRQSSATGSRLTAASPQSVAAHTPKAA
eukprot:SAG11_NODE_1387_length_5065_cov_12.530099_6_plen_320_part_01